MRSDRTILSSVVLRQDHHDTQGIHPLHAAQAHHRHVPVAIRQALDEAAVSLDDIDGLAVTQGPGMPGCLSVGMAAAKALASVHRKPLVYVHHMHGMFYVSHSPCAHALAHGTAAAHVPFSHAAGLGRPYDAGPGPQPVPVPSAGQHTRRLDWVRTPPDTSNSFDKLARELELGWQSASGVLVEQLAATHPHGAPLPPLPHIMLGQPSFSLYVRPSHAARASARPQRGSSRRPVVRRI